MRRGAITLALGLAGAACGGDGGASDVAGDATASDARDVTSPSDPWTRSTVTAGVGGAGRQIQAAALPDGTPIVAAYDEASAPDGACYASEPAAGERARWTLRYAEADGDGWAVEEVAGIWHLGGPRGFDLAVAPDGAPHIAALTGEPDAVARYCGANDLGVYRRGAGGAWAVEVAVATSGQAATGEPASDFGTVVGLWPALAFDEDGGAHVAYKDVHGGGLQADDFRRADLELATRAPGGGWAQRAVDWGQGAGDFAAAAFDREGALVIVQFNPRDDLTASERGLWALRSDDGGETWARVRLLAGGTGERPSLAVSPTDGAIWVAWYDGAVGLPYVARLDDVERFAERAAWDIEDIGDRVFDEGRHPSIAVSADGLVAVAYQRCGRASDGIGDCNPARDAVVFAWRDGAIWEREVAVDEPDGLCGNYTTLVFAGDEPVIFHQCQVDSGAGFVMELRAARREAP
ncbi:MAG: hypothetical protein IT385_01250 [Deltaproteobacteria bacterium]|nr:hypothetical protein [Deltaproteobacteria bacterium]